QFHADGTAGLLLPAIHVISPTPLVADVSQHPGALSLSDFAGKWSRAGMSMGGNPAGDISLVLVSSIAVTNWAGPIVSPQWSGFPVQPFGYLKLTAVLKFDSKAAEFSGPLQYTVNDMNGKTLFAFTATVRLASVGLER